MNTKDDAQLQAAREVVHGFLRSREKWTRGLFIVACMCEIGFGVLMMFFMDFADRLHWFLLFGFCMVYCPLILFSWRNAILIDRLYYRLVDDLKFGDQKD